MNTKSRKQGFLQGALILAIANILVKIIGACYKIPLRRFILGPDGMGIYNASYNIYNVLFVVATAGLPVAISKMISESAAKGNYLEVNKIYKISRMVLFIIGIIGSATLLIGATVFTSFIKTQQATRGIMALSPCIFFVAIMSVYRGFNQGMSNMVPTAMSEVIESFGKLILGLVLAYVLLPMGKSVSAAGAILGVSTGSFLSAAYLFIYQTKLNKEIKKKIKESPKQNCRSNKEIFVRLVKLAVPITIGASVFTLASFIDLMMIMRQLAGLGFDEATRTTLYGYYSGDAVTLFNLPPTVITALCISIVPAIASAMVKGDKLGAKKTTETAIRMTLMFALPCGVGMSVLSGPILTVVMGDSGAETLLSILAYGSIFVSIVMISNSVLQSLGKVWLPVIHMCIGGAVKVIVNYILVGNINININGAPVGTDCCYLVTAMLNLISIHRCIRPNYGINFILKSLLSVVIMGAAAYFTFNLLAPMLGTTLSLAVAILFAAIIYFSLLILTRAIKKQDILAMPKSEKILKIFGKFI